MRWTDKERIGPEYGKVILHSAFLFFPKRMFNRGIRKNETRWLERATWIKKYYGFTNIGTLRWEDEEWYDEEE
jgi:hypothetical protein